MKEERQESKTFYDAYEEEAIHLATTNKLNQIRAEIEKLGGYEILITDKVLFRDAPNLFRIKKCAYQDVLVKVEQEVLNAHRIIDRYTTYNYSAPELESLGKFMQSSEYKRLYAKILNLTSPNSKIHRHLRAGFDGEEKALQKRKRLERYQLELSMTNPGKNKDKSR